jgi:hypothetical protein
VFLRKVGRDREEGRFERRGEDVSITRMSLEWWWMS